MDIEQRLRALYVAFNAREMDTVLAALAEDVDWPNAWEGGRLRGRAEVREYWTRQWAEIDGRVEPVGFATRPDGRVAVEVDQTVRDLEGALLSEGRVRHVWAFRAGLVVSMDVEEPESPSLAMARSFRLAIDEETLTDELFAFVVDPRSTRTQRRIVSELRALAPGMIPVMEMMILDGVEERRHVRDYVAAVIGGGADRDVYYAT